MFTRDCVEERKEEETSSFRKTQSPSSRTSQYEHIVRLSTPKTRSRSSQEAGPPHTPHCENNCPIWHVDPKMKSAVITLRLLQLSDPKVNHPDFQSNRESVASIVSLASKTVQISQRLVQLSLPRLKESNVCCQLGRPEESIWTPLSDVYWSVCVCVCVCVLQSQPLKSAGTQVLVLGLDGAGKTSLLHCLASGSLEQDIQPTQGFNAVSINKGDLHIEFLEIGGKEELRPYWKRYMSKALMLVFVVDSSGAQLFPLAKTLLHELLASDPRLPLMVLANKQDLPGACGITDLHEALSLSEVGDRRLFLIGTHVKKGEAELSSGVMDARNLIIQMVSDI
ncbi:uncharacterized protein LOC118333937 [Morone saxatilis]|uniref:uncharacterized protein LOC118333937 n=1 Tax=Morone saxatilis TaxID=34816 RepID=UPI0015E22940|nr:uncharacterized protein LOC118333937 [Morone saxatilis]